MLRGHLPQNPVRSGLENRCRRRSRGRAPIWRLKNRRRIRLCNRGTSCICGVPTLESWRHIHLRYNIVRELASLLRLGNRHSIRLQYSCFWLAPVAGTVENDSRINRDLSQFRQAFLALILLARLLHGQHPGRDHYYYLNPVLHLDLHL